MNALVHRAGATRCERAARRRRSATSVVGYCSVTVYFDPLRVDAAWLEERDRADRRRRSRRRRARCVARVVEVPVCYGGELGPDLADVAAFAGCSGGGGHRAARSRATTACTWSASCRGSPTWPRSIRGSPRRAARTPRTRGAGRIGGDRRRADRHLSDRRRPAAGTSSAGRRCARTIRARREPFLFQAGRSRPVPSRSRRDESRRADAAVMALLTVVRPGHADDRPGPRPLGPSGAWVCRSPARWTEYSHRLANRLVGNDDDGRRARDHADRARARRRTAT